MGEETDDAPITPGHRISYAGYRSIEWLTMILPIELVAAIGGMLGRLGHALIPQRRKIVMRNLRIAFGSEKDDRELRAICRKTFWNAGANFFSTFRTNTMAGDRLAKHIQFSGTEHLRSAQQSQQGTILLLAHMGNWESLTRMNLMMDGLDPFGGLYRPLGNPLLDRLIKKRREGTGTRLFSRKDGFFAPIAHLKNNGTLGVFADQHAGNSGLAVPLFGKTTSMTSLPALLHRRTGAAIVPASMCTTSPGNWEIKFHPAIKIDEDARKNALLCTSLCASAFETIMRDSPADVLWMHGYWKVGSKRPLKIDGLQKHHYKHQLRFTQPFKIIVFTGNADATNREVSQAIEKLASYRDDVELTTVGSHRFGSHMARHIPMAGDEPPHIVTNRITKLDREMTTPFDCMIDLTPDAQGETILKNTGISDHFAAAGSRISVTFKIKYPDKSQRTLSGLLDRLGIYGKTE